MAPQVEGSGRKALRLEPLTPEAPDAGGVGGAVDQNDRRTAARVYAATTPLYRRAPNAP